jgi:hypothetical protein
LLYLSTGGTVFSDGYSYGYTSIGEYNPSVEATEGYPQFDGGRSLI